MSVPTAEQANEIIRIGNVLVPLGQAILAGLGTPPPPPPPPPTVPGVTAATFLGADTSTRGNWKSAFGPGQVIGDSKAFPSFAVIVPSGKDDYTWAPSTNDSKALQRAATGRIAACWYGNSFTVDVNLTDGQPHRIALYCLDWDGARSMRIDVLDGQKVLDSQTVNAFQNGVYLKWTVQGHVTFRFTNLVGANAVLSGVFVD